MASTMQKILNRQNIYDGLWEKTPSMSWGFVPLTKYQGGGAEAVLEPAVWLARGHARAIALQSARKHYRRLAGCDSSRTAERRAYEKSVYQ